MFNNSISISGNILYMIENDLEVTVYKRSHKALLAFSKRVVIMLSCAMFLNKRNLPTKID